MKKNKIKKLTESELMELFYKFSFFKSFDLAEKLELSKADFFLSILIQKLIL